jgi:puromycin-sensitive aminopeptidase
MSGRSLFSHIRKHSYGNAVTADLWKELEAASPVPVTAVAKDFTEQEGVPLVEVLSTRCSPGEQETQVVLRQSRFGLDVPSRRQKTWHVPVTAIVVGESRLARQIVRGPSQQTIKVAGCGPVKINAGENGYFRTLYDAQSLAALRQSFARLTPADQLGLLNDSFGLAEGGYQSFRAYLDLTQTLSNDSDPLVLLQFIRGLQTFDGFFPPDTGAAFRAFARRRLGALMAATGWNRRENEPANAGTLRAALIEALGQFNDRVTVEEARRRFLASREQAALLPPDIRQAVVNVVGAHADSAMFEELRSRAARSTDTAEKRMYLLALAGAYDGDIAKKAMELTLTDAVPSHLASNMILAAANVNPEAAFDFATAHFEAFEQRLDAFARIGFIPSIASQGSEAGLARKLEAFAKEHIGEAGRESVERARSAILFNESLRRTHQPEVQAWVAQNTNATAKLRALPSSHARGDL